MTEEERRRWAAALTRAEGDSVLPPAAVLVALVETEEGLSVLLELRARTMHDQPGTVCLPGGGMEPGETAAEAALRETEEEMGLPRRAISLLGALPPFQHRDLRTVYPVVGVLEADALACIVPSPAEVERWFTVPLRWLRENAPKSCRYVLTLTERERVPEDARVFLDRVRVERETSWWNREGLHIWGLTARILLALLAAAPENGDAAEALPPVGTAIRRSAETDRPEAPHPSTKAGEADGSLWQLETNLDDSTGEQLGLTLELLLTAGARDVWYQPIVMKKSRPGWLLSVLCGETDVSRLEGLLFTHTTTIGVRRFPVGRTALPRRMERVETAYGSVRVKCVTLPNGDERAYPEYEDVAALVRAAGRSYQELYALAQEAWRRRSR